LHVPRPDLNDVDIIDRGIPQIPVEVLVFGSRFDDLLVEFPELQDAPFGILFFPESPEQQYVYLAPVHGLIF
jgi:hypothetical protein